MWLHAAPCGLPLCLLVCLTPKRLVVLGNKLKWPDRQVLERTAHASERLCNYLDCRRRLTTMPSASTGGTSVRPLRMAYVCHVRSCCCTVVSGGAVVLWPCCCPCCTSFCCCCCSWRWWKCCYTSTSTCSLTAHSSLASHSSLTFAVCLCLHVCACS